jgi:hypothetical protein
VRARDYVKGNVAYHEELNPRAWAGDQLRPEVQVKLLQIAKRFVDYLEIPGFRVLDVVLTGSMANYNWTQYSDFDIHVVTNYADLQCDDLAEAFYQAKKKIWNDAHDITIHGHEAELYVEDINEPPVSAGMYSLLHNEWVKKPSYDPPEINDAAVNSKVQDLVKQIEVALKSDQAADVQRVTDKIRQMRRSGLDSAGEFGTENLAFKVLRNLGYLNRLSKAYLHRQDNELSI